MDDNKYVRQYVDVVIGIANIPIHKSFLNKLQTYQSQEFDQETLKQLVSTLQDHLPSKGVVSANTKRIAQSVSKKSSKRIQASNVALKRFMYAFSVAIAAVLSILNS